MSGRGFSDVMRNDPSVVKVRGLPYEAAALDVCRFFQDCKIRNGPRGIYFCVNERNQPTGEAFIEMEGLRDIDAALRRHRDRMGGRYIEVFETRQSVMDKVIRAGATNERGFNENRRGSGRPRLDDSPPPRRLSLRDSNAGRRDSYRDRSYDRADSSRGCESSEFCVRLRGLPWSATKLEIEEFLGRCRVAGGQDGVIICKDERDRPSGDAYVELETRDDLDLALMYHKKNMGSRYVEVFEAHPKDVARAKDEENRGNTSGPTARRRGNTTGSIVTLRGLPYSCTEREISNWLSEAADPIQVDIIMDRTGRPSGQAVAYFKTAREAKAVAKAMHRRDLGHRYIEVYYEDDL